MKNEKQDSSKPEDKRLNDEELQKIEKFKDIVEKRKEIVEWLDIYSCFFADWSVIINESVHEVIEKKQLLGLPYDNEQIMLTNINYFFNKTAFHNKMISEWNEDLAHSKVFFRTLY